ncbi:MAG: hypothetical protein HKO64_12665, partial [Xanthomonadales bacterium]|nr:hypothetical protein [Xanthomonadales bacterium]
MIAARQKAYLDAMNIPVWVLRSTAEASNSACAVQLGPGSGQVLLLCASREHSAGKLASDIARALRIEPVWGWPVDDPSCPLLAESVGERLFTHIVVFGSDAELSGFGGPASELLGSAAVIRAPAMPDLRQSAAERRKLWAQLCQ